MSENLLDILTEIADEIENAQAKYDDSESTYPELEVSRAIRRVVARIRERIHGA